ncbi:MAG: flagellar hook-length control protein FliK [Pikeienuella sp.]
MIIGETLDGESDLIAQTDMTRAPANPARAPGETGAPRAANSGGAAKPETGHDPAQAEDAAPETAEAGAFAALLAPAPAEAGGVAAEAAPGPMKRAAPMIAASPPEEESAAPAVNMAPETPAPETTAATTIEAPQPATGPQSAQAPVDAEPDLSEARPIPAAPAPFPPDAPPTVTDTEEKPRETNVWASAPAEARASPAPAQSAPHASSSSASAPAPVPATKPAPAPAAIGEAAISGPDISPSISTLSTTAARAEQASAPGSPPQTSERMAAQVSAQIAQTAARAGGERVEIRLDPPELGRVQLSLSMDRDGVTATISAERPEILDLMRRHGELLQRDLGAAGHRNVTLEFARADTGDGPQTGARPQNQPQGKADAGEPAETVTRFAVNWRARPDDRLDIRL